jgi:hypothetical protein
MYSRKKLRAFLHRKRVGLGYDSPKTLFCQIEKEHLPRPSYLMEEKCQEFLQCCSKVWSVKSFLKHHLVHYAPHFIRYMQFFQTCPRPALGTQIRTVFS